jgi:hypothetical protein
MTLVKNPKQLVEDLIRKSLQNPRRYLTLMLLLRLSDSILS